MKIAIPISEADGPVQTDITKATRRELEDFRRLVSEVLAMEHSPRDARQISNQLLLIEAEIRKRDRG